MTEPETHTLDVPGAGPCATGPQRRVRPYAQEVTVTVTEAPNPRPVDGCVVQPWRV